ncbi:hypothetical protein SEPCBS57363_004049 [Sporothrix epigloea]|uniref:DUF7892 domain-containing protein n=1 Tax=Sporothrix epigloea TaxID=1892477 RepID=A0ABP0DPX4_9PEZI
MDLLLSSASTFLIPALQFIFITSDTRLVPLSIIERGLLPPATTLKKLFWTADVEKLREEFSTVRELGAPAVEEWQKGLHTRGSVQRSETTKLEKFSDSGGIASMRSVLYPGYKSLNAALPGPSAGEKKKSQDATPVGDTPQKTGHQGHVSNGAVSRTGTDKTATDAVPTTPLRTNKIALENVLLAPLPASDERKPSEDVEKVCDEAQGLIRRKILRYADEAIGGGWEGGAKVTEYNAPAFAVDVLLHVRKRFYKEVEMEARLARAAGREPIVDPREGPFSRKLSLENMNIGDKQKISDIRSIQELPCKTCYLQLGGVPERSESMTLFSLPQLLSHFYDVHAGGLAEDWNGRQVPSINWLTDMIIYPQPPSLLTMVSKTKDCGKAGQMLSEAVNDLISGEDGGWQPVFNIYAARKQALADRQTPALPYDSTTKKAIRAQQNPNKKTDNPITPISQQLHKVDNSRIDGTTKLSENTDKPAGTKQPAGKQTVKYESKQEAQSTARNVPSKPKTAEPVAEAQSTARNGPSKNKTAEPAEESQADLLGALEMHLKGEPGNQTGVSKKPKEAAMVPARTKAHERSVDERDRQPPLRQEVRGRANGDTDDWARPTYRRERSPVPPPEHHRPVSRVAFEQFRERSPLRARRYVDETSFASSRGDYDEMYERGQPRQALSSHDNQRYGPPPNRQHYYEDHVDESGRRGPSSQPLDHDRYEVYDIVRVVDPEGDYYVRRPVRRKYTQAPHRELDRYESPISADGRVPLRRRAYGGDYHHGSGFASPQDSYAFGARHEWDNEMHTPVRETGGERSGRPPLVAHPRTGRDGAAMDKKYNQHIPGRGARIAD